MIQIYFSRFMNLIYASKCWQNWIEPNLELGDVQEEVDLKL